MESHTYVKNLTPIEVDEQACGYNIRVWNRTYTIANAPFLSSVLSGGKELLAAPMQVVGIENGEELLWTDIHNIVMDERTDTAVQAGQSMQSKRFILNTGVTIENDGCMDWHMTVMPRGRSVNQVFGLDAEDKGDRILEKLWLEIPLKKEAATCYQFLPIGPVELDGVPMQKPLSMWQMGAVPEKSICVPFRQQFYLGNDHIGFAVFFESNQHWQIADPNKAIECEITEDAVLLRLHILDSEPVSWKKKGRSNGMDLFPISFRIGMQATPVKPFPKNPFPERSLHIDCFKKIPQDYEDFLMNPLTEGDTEIVMDRIQRLGVKTLYIHEKWNEIQNSPALTKKTADRLRLIVDQAHKRGIKVIPYFGYELSTLSPIWGIHHKKFTQGIERGHWYRTPWQRDLVVCYASEWQDYFVERIEKLIDQFGFDGIYIDSVLSVHACENESHGCGYRDEMGNLHKTYPIWAIRKLMKRIYRIMEDRGCTVSNHSYGAFPVPALAYTHLMWEGESVQAPMLQGAIHEAPENYLRAMFSGRMLGVPVYMLCYSNPPTWTFRQAMSNALPFGIIPKPVDTGEHLEQMSGVWKALDRFPMEKAEWKPYFENGVTVSHPEVKVSYFDAGDQLLLFVVNMRNVPTGQVTIEMPTPIAIGYDAVTEQPYPVQANSLEISFEKFDYIILRLHKSKH